MWKRKIHKNIIGDFNLENIEITALDISDNVMKSLPENANKVQGRLTNLPFSNDKLIWFIVVNH